MLSTGGNRKQANEALLMHHPTIIISWTTLNSWLNASRDLDLFKHTKDVSSTGLTSKEDRELLQTIAMQRDDRNQGMTRKDIIVLISELGGSSIKHTENHFNYLVTSKQLCQLKWAGCVVSAQPSMTNRTTITTKK